MLRRRARGTVALEAALTLPVMALAFMGLYDTSRALTTWSRMSLAADAVTQIATNFLVDPYNGNPFLLQTLSARKSTDAVFAYLPDWRPVPNRLAITLTSVQSNGSQAHTVWSYSSGRGRQARRPCGNLGTGNAMNQVPASMLPLPAFLVVDVAYTYQPTFLRLFNGNFSFKATSYLPARSITDNGKIDFDTPGDPNVTYCP